MSVTVADRAYVLSTIETVNIFREKRLRAKIILKIIVEELLTREVFSVRFPCTWYRPQDLRFAFVGTDQEPVFFRRLPIFLVPLVRTVNAHAVRAWQSDKRLLDLAYIALQRHSDDAQGLHKLRWICWHHSPVATLFSAFDFTRSPVICRVDLLIVISTLHTATLQSTDGFCSITLLDAKIIWMDASMHQGSVVGSLL